MNHKENYNKSVKRRLRKCGEAVETIHEVIHQKNNIVELGEFLDEMYLNLMRSESYLAQHDSKRFEATWLYQMLRDSFRDLKEIPLR
jgi:hypothetical protein